MEQTLRPYVLTAAALTLAACGSSTSPTTPITQTDNSGIYVTTAGNTVVVFPLTATGNVAPSRTISGAATGLSLPIGIGVDSKGSLYVANRSGAKITVYAAGANGNVAPTRALTDTGMKSPQALVIGSGDDVYAVTCPNCGQSAGGTTGMFHFPNGANSIDYFLAGSNTGMTVPNGIGLDASKNIFIGNAFGGIVGVYAPGASGNSLPIRSFNPGASLNVQATAVSGNTIILTAPGSGIVTYLTTTSAAGPPAATLAPSASLPISYPAQAYLDTSVPQPVIYLADYGAGAIRVITTTGTAPNLGVNTVTSISGALTGLSSPLGITVVH